MVRRNDDHTEAQGPSPAGRSLLVAWVVGGIVIGALALFLIPLLNKTEGKSSGSEASTTVNEVVTEPNAAFIGKSITVSGEVEEVLGQRTFTVEGKGLFDDPELLVLSATEAPIIEDTLVQVKGTIREFVVADIKREFDLELAQEVERKFRDKPVLIATAVTLTPPPGEIAEEPNKFLGLIVTVSSEVEKVLSPNAFTLDDKEFIGGKELLVVGAVPAGGTIDQDETVRVTGRVRKFVTAEVERDFDFDLQPELEVEYEGRAVVIAQSIQVVE